MYPVCNGTFERLIRIHHRRGSLIKVACFVEFPSSFILNLFSSLTKVLYLLQGLIGFLTKLATRSLLAVRTLFELNISSILKGVLMASDLSHSNSYSSLQEPQSNQVFSTTFLVYMFSKQQFPMATRPPVG